MLTTLSRAIEAQEDKLNREGPERTAKEKAALETYRKLLNKISVESPDVSLEETNEKLAQAMLDFQKQGLKDGFSQDVVEDFLQDVGSIKTMLPVLEAGKNWDGVYESQAFIDDLDTQLDPGDKFITGFSGAEELLRVGKVADVDLSEIQLEPDAIAALSPAKRTQWDNLTNMMTGNAATSAVGETSREMAGLFQEVGERDVNANPLVPDQDKDGNRILDEEGNPKMIRARELYPRLLRKHMTDALIREVNDTTKLKAVIDEARRIKGSKVEAPKDPLASAVLEEELGSSDFLDEDGKTTNLSDYKKVLFGPAYDVRLRNHLNRWAATAVEPESLALMEDKTPRGKIDSDLESMVNIVSSGYLGKVGALINSKNKKPTERTKIRAELENQLKYTGIPMDVHEKNLLVKYSSSRSIGSYPNYGGFGGSYSPPRIYSTYDLNRDDLYSRPKTAKTHVYNYQAIRDTRDGNYEKLTTLYNIHFKGKEESYPIETFFADQEALGKQLKFNPSK
jgi:hypothetical protein